MDEETKKEIDDIRRMAVILFETFAGKRTATIMSVMVFVARDIITSAPEDKWDSGAALFGKQLKDGVAEHRRVKAMMEVLQ